MKPLFSEHVLYSDCLIRLICQWDSEPILFCHIYLLTFHKRVIWKNQIKSLLHEPRSPREQILQDLKLALALACWFDQASVKTRETLKITTE